MDKLMKTQQPIPLDSLMDMNEKILQIKNLARDLESGAGQFPGIEKNAKRILASIKMMEFNLCDAMSFDIIDP